MLNDSRQGLVSSLEDAIPRAVYFLMGRGNSRELAEDAVLYGAAQVLRNAASIKNVGAVSAYLVKCAMRYAALESRRRDRNLELHEGYDKVTLPEDAAMDRSQLHECFSKLTPLQKAALHDKYSAGGDRLPLQGFGDPAVAKLSASPEAVRQARSHGMANLRRCLFQQGLTCEDLL